MFLIEGPVQRYAWGSTTAIPEFLGVPPDGEPQAELWLGANAAAPAARARDGVSLEVLIEAEPTHMLGAFVEKSFGELPFLLKLLAVSAPLSIQAHPSRAQAEEGYVRESRAGIPLDAAMRTYRDRRAKPEMLYAISPFEMLCGFRDPEETAHLYAELGISALLPARRALCRGGSDALRAVTEHFVGLDAGTICEVVSALHAACSGPGTRPELACLACLADRYPDDVGVLIASLLNHVILGRGSAVFLPARTLHSYLRGVGLELMGNSDNVVRAGLTPKHVDVPEVLRIVEFEPARVPELVPGRVGSGQTTYSAPVREFRLDIVRSSGGRGVDVDQWGPDILLCLEGEISMTGRDLAGGPLRVRHGQAAFVPAATRGYRVAGEGRVARATVAPPE